MKSLTDTVCAHHEKLPCILQTLLEQIGLQRYNAWFKHGTTIGIQDGHVHVAVPNPFVANWIEQHYLGALAAATALHLDASWPVVVAVDAGLSQACSQRKFDQQAEIVACDTEGRSRKHASQKTPLQHVLKDFVVGASNRNAYAAAIAMGQGSDSPYRQLFVHGPCGVGKTHLLQGVCQKVSQNPSLRWRYVTGEQFTNEFLTALRHKRTAEFRQRYRKLDLLAIDDVHFLAAKRATQEEFLHTFNAIESAGRQIILASDAPPRLVGDLNEQLVTRFLSGVIFRIDTPDFVTRNEILVRKARTLKLRLPADVLDYLSQHLRGSVREIEGTLLKLSAIASLENGGVDLDMTRDALADHLAQADSAITLADIEAIVSTFFGITPADLHSSRRTRTVSGARMTAMFLARKYTRMSFPEIGRLMGKNHSSVVLACQRMETLLANKGDLQWRTPAGAKFQSAEQLLRLLEEQIR